MSTATKNEPETVGHFTRIGHWLWAGYSPAGNFQIVCGEDPLNRAEGAVLVPRADVPALLRVLTPPDQPAAEPTREQLEGHRQSIRAIVDRLTALEVLVGARVERRLDALEEHDRERSERSEHAEISTVRAQVGTLATMVEGLMELVERQQQKSAESQPLASDYATKDFVSQAINRLNGALREHIRKTFENAILAAAPGPGVLARIWDAIYPAPPAVEPNRRYRVSTFTPERAVALGTEAAAAASAQRKVGGA